jgi:two-component system OmpR family sensor kinase
MRKKRYPLRFMRALPIRWRLALASLGLLTLLLSSLGIIISLVSEQALMTNEVNALHNEAQVATKAVMKNVQEPQQHAFSLSADVFPPGPAATNFDTTALALLHALVGLGTNTNATILTPTGTTVLALASSPFISPAIQVTPDQVRQIMQTSNQYLLMKDAQRQRQLIVFIPLAKNFHTVGILQISTPTAPIDNFFATFNLILFLGIVSTLGLAIALIFPLVGIALRPLVEIEHTSRKIAQGELSIRIDQPLTDDEIGRLARSFNRMVARLETAFQKQKHFVGDVSHELRTPLTALSGSLEMLIIGADQGNPEVTRRLARGMFAEVQRMHRMVEDLLALTRLHEGKLALRQDVIGVETVFATICELAEHLAQGQELRCVIEPDIPDIHADRDHLQQVLLNLMDNALKFTMPEGQIELRARRGPRQTVLLTVSDTGQGIPAEALPQVFDRFYRVDPARNHSPHHKGGSGSGLGLAIAKELIEAQGGSITIESILDQGTCVTICFPAIVPPERTKHLEKRP